MQSIIRGGTLASILLSCLLTACGSSNSGGGGSNSVPATTTRTVSMVMNKAWTDTGIAVTAGQQQSITASGTFEWLSGSPCIFPGEKCSATPAGEPWVKCATQPPPVFTAPGLACWSLIGRIGTNGMPFEVGTSLQLTDKVSGELWLGVNDNVFIDDKGTWSATVTSM